MAGCYFLTSYGSQALVVSWLILASLVFYAWDFPQYLFLLGSSILVNFTIAQLFLSREWTKRLKLSLLWLGIGFNVFLLGYFKYTNFFLDVFQDLAETQFTFERIVLPLGISFITFQQIGFLMDAYIGQVKDLRFINYALFICFFPQLIAGPICHHKTLLSQINEPNSISINSRSMLIGSVFLCIGLFKKLFIADAIALFVNPVFDLAESGKGITFVEGWLAAVSYTLQVYFDFSGYSDMAIGLGAMFSLRIPVNFRSPYKSASITEFWQRWHITLGDFLTKYIYTPIHIGLHRRFGKNSVLVRQSLAPSIAILLTLMISGFWHGAGFQFIVFGIIHGVALIVHRFWQRSTIGRRFASWPHWILVARTMTFLFIIVTLVIFRAGTLQAGFSYVQTLFGLHGFELESSVGRKLPIVVLSGLLLWIHLLPNSQELMQRVTVGVPTENNADWKWYHFTPTFRWAVACAFLLVLSVACLSRTQELIYYHF